jgi:hypothetical protein
MDQRQLNEGSTKIRTWYYSAWIKRRGHRDDNDVPKGEARDPDDWLELTGVVPLERVVAFLEDAVLQGRAVYGVLIATRPEEG